jgi:hypothetical protein
MGIGQEDYGDFRAAFKQLRKEGRIIKGMGKAMILPEGQSTVL